MEQLLPVLTVKLATRTELLSVLRSTLGREEIALSLDAPAANAEPHALEVHAPGLPWPIVVLAQPTKGSRLRLQPMNDEQEGEVLSLLAFAQQVGQGIETSQGLEGRTLGAGKYRIGKLLGSGAVGKVHAAMHVPLGKPIAIKVLHDFFRADARFASRFQREALAASQLDHPNVCRVLDFGEEPNGLLYIAMELLEGRSLYDLVQERGPMALERVVEIMSQVCAALSSAHDRGVVHRDVKSDNIVVSEREDDDGVRRVQVKVCDFGLATIAGARGEGVARITASGTIAGTPEYMSPEQARGDEVDARTDVYACGVVLYEMATGRLPFVAESVVGVLTKQVSDPPVPPTKVDRRVDPRLEAVILRTLAKSRDDRYPSARDLRAALRALVADGARSRTASPNEVPVPSFRNRTGAQGGSGRTRTASAWMPASLGDAGSGFAELFVALVSAMGRGGADAGTLASVVRAADVALRGRREIALVRPRGAATVDVRSPGLDPADLARVLPPSIAGAYVPRFVDLLARGRVVCLALREGATEADIGALLAAFARGEPRAASSPGVLVVGEADLPSERLPADVETDVARIVVAARVDGPTRLADDLADVAREARPAESTRALFLASDAIARAISTNPSAVAHSLVEASPVSACVAAGKLLGSTKTEEALLAIIAARLVNERTPEGDELLATATRAGRLAGTSLPQDLRSDLAIEKRADTLGQKPDRVKRLFDPVIDDALFAREIDTLVATAQILASRGAIASLVTIVDHVRAYARGEGPGTPPRRARATETVRAMLGPEVLGALADAFFVGPVAERDRARALLASSGELGAQAACSARERLASPSGRSRFVALVREIGASAIPAVVAALARAPRDERGEALVEDLLRAVPEAPDESAGHLVAHYIGHASAPIRRAALGALASLWRSHAKKELRAALADPDEGVRVAAIAALRRVRGVDEEVVRALDRLLLDTALGEELRASAAAALVDVDDAARSLAFAVLSRALAARGKGMLALFTGASSAESTLVVETVCRAMLAIGGETGRREVEKRAAQATGPLRAKLVEILGG